MSDARTNGYIRFISRRPSKVVISFITLVAFLFNTVSYDYAWADRTPSAPTSVGADSRAVSPVSPGAFKELNVKTFVLPQSLGTIKDSWQPPVIARSPAVSSGATKQSQTTIIHIQDAHCNYYAQHAIADIIEYLNKEYGVSQINLEGGAKDYDLSIFTSIKDENARERVADYFVKEGIVNGAEYFAINNAGKVNLWGIENTKLYIDNLRVYRNSLKYKADTDKLLGNLSNSLSNLKMKLYSKELLELDLKYNQYKANTIEFKDYLNYLMSNAKEKLINIKSFNNIFLLSQSLKAEGEIDFGKANNQRDELIDKLQKRLSKNAMKELVEKTVAFRAGLIPQEEFYTVLVNMVKPANVPIGNYPELEKYIVYIATYAAVDKAKIIDDVTALETKLREVLYQNDKQRELDKLSKNLAILKNIFNISLTRADYRYYKANEASFDMSNYISFIDSCRGGLNLPYNGVNAKDLTRLDGYREEMSKFYEYSFKRDEAFLKNMKGYGLRDTGYAAKSSYPVTRTPLPKSEVSILITGGFHTENLVELLKKNGTSYISIIPNFKSSEGYQCPYFNILSGADKTQLVKAVPAMLAGNIAAASQLNPTLYNDVVKAFGGTPINAPSVAAPTAPAVTAPAPAPIQVAPQPTAPSAAVSDAAVKAQKDFTAEFGEKAPEVLQFVSNKEIGPGDIESYKKTSVQERQGREVFRHELIVSGLGAIIFYTKRNNLVPADFDFEARVFSAVYREGVGAQQFTTDDGNVLVMQEVKGKPLDELISSDTYATADNLQIAEAVMYELGRIHGLGVVHSDIAEPDLDAIMKSNIIISKDGKAGFKASFIDFDNAFMEGTERPPKDTYFGIERDSLIRALFKELLQELNIRDDSGKLTEAYERGKESAAPSAAVEAIERTVITNAKEIDKMVEKLKEELERDAAETGELNKHTSIKEGQYLLGSTFIPASVDTTQCFEFGLGKLKAILFDVKGKQWFADNGYEVPYSSDGELYVFSIIDANSQKVIGHGNLYRPYKDTSGTVLFRYAIHEKFRDDKYQNTADRPHYGTEALKFIAGIAVNGKIFGVDISKLKWGIEPGDNLNPEGVGNVRDFLQKPENGFDNNLELTISKVTKTPAAAPSAGRVIMSREDLERGTAALPILDNLENGMRESGYSESALYAAKLFYEESVTNAMKAIAVELVRQAYENKGGLQALRDKEELEADDIDLILKAMKDGKSRTKVEISYEIAPDHATIIVKNNGLVGGNIAVLKQKLEEEIGEVAPIFGDERALIFGAGVGTGLAAGYASKVGGTITPRSENNWAVLECIIPKVAATTKPAVPVNIEQLKAEVAELVNDYSSKYGPEKTPGQSFDISNLAAQIKQLLGRFSALGKFEIILTEVHELDKDGTHPMYGITGGREDNFGTGDSYYAIGVRISEGALIFSIAVPVRVSPTTGAEWLPVIGAQANAANAAQANVTWSYRNWVITPMFDKTFRAKRFPIDKAMSRLYKEYDGATTSAKYYLYKNLDNETTFAENIETMLEDLQKDMQNVLREKPDLDPRAALFVPDKTFDSGKTAMEIVRNIITAKFADIGDKISLLKDTVPDESTGIIAEAQHIDFGVEWLDYVRREKDYTQEQKDKLADHVKTICADPVAIKDAKADDILNGIKNGTIVLRMIAPVNWDAWDKEQKAYIKLREAV